MRFRKIIKRCLSSLIVLLLAACQSDQTAKNSVRSAEPLIEGYQTYQDAHVTVHYPPGEKDLVDVIVKENTFPIYFGNEEKFNQKTATWKERDLLTVAHYLGLEEPLPIMLDTYVQFQNLLYSFFRTAFSSVNIFYFDDLKKKLRSGINIDGLKYDRFNDKITPSLSMYGGLSNVDKDAKLSGSLSTISSLHLILQNEESFSERTKAFHDKYGTGATNLFTDVSFFLVLHETSEVGFMVSTLRGIDSRWISDGFANTVAFLVLKTHDENKNLSIDELVEKYDLWQTGLNTIMDIDLETWVRANRIDESLRDFEYYDLATCVFLEIIKECGTEWIPDFCRRLRIRGNANASVKEAYAVFTEITGKDMCDYISKAKLRMIEIVREDSESSATDKKLADALICELNGDYPAASQLFDALGDSGNLTTREKADIYFQKARVLAKAQNNEDALECYDNGLKLAPDVTVAWLNRAYLLDLIGKPGEADICFKKVNELYPRCAEGLTEKGRMFYLRKDYAIAMDYCEKALRVNPNFAEAWTIKGAILENTGNIVSAEQCIDRALELNPNDIDSLRNRAIMCYRKADMENAIIYLDKALFIDPDFVDGLDVKAKILYNMGRKEDALVCLNKLIEINPKNHEAWDLKMNLLTETGKNEEAVIFCDELLKTEPENLSVWLKKGILQENFHKKDEAMICYNRAIEINSGDPAVWYYKGRFLLHINQNDEAAVCLGKSVSINPKAFNTWYLLGIALRKTDRNTEALGAFMKAREIDPDDDKNNKQIEELEDVLLGAAID